MVDIQHIEHASSQLSEMVTSMCDTTKDNDDNIVRRGKYIVALKRAALTSSDFFYLCCRHVSVVG
jgi:hypothetical protein